jgi:hypothetical protein
MSVKLRDIIYLLPIIGNLKLLKKLQKLERKDLIQKDLIQREKDLIVYYEARIETIYQNVLNLLTEGLRAGGGELSSATLSQKNTSLSNGELESDRKVLKSRESPVIRRP